MEEQRRLIEFAEKWLAKFRDEKSTDYDLADHFLADDCKALGFEMDCGHAFGEKYGRAEHCWEELVRVIDEVDDIALLGSAIYSRWRYFNHWAGPGEYITDEPNRKWFVIALDRMLTLAKEMNLFHGTIQKIRLISSDLCYGPMPGPDDEVEQRLTLNNKGQVWFSAYNFGSPGVPAQKIKKRHFGIEPDAAEKLLAYVAHYFGHEHEEFLATDVGMWQLELTNTDGETYKFVGSMGAEILTDGVNLSEQIRKILGMDDLFIFDGNYKPDSINRIAVDYHRVNKIKPDVRPEGATWEYATWDYTEQLVIDRATETLEHTRIIGSGCKISHKYEIEGGIENLLDSFDSDYFFSYIEETPDDVIENPMETKDYKITVDFDQAEPKVLSGSFDKDGLPADFSDFAETVLDFISFYGLGEILDPDTYEKRKRHKNDYIYCSVAFDDGYKTYHYIADDDNIKADDFVVVPVGKDNHEAVVRVEKVEYFSGEDVPFPVGKTKHIIRKANQNDFVPPDDDTWSVLCPALQRNVNLTECVEISDVANDYINERILQDYDPPILWTEEMKKKCMDCKYHFLE